ncbi:MAG: TetR/AcrR family transcriptional regulator [Thermodesulfobacteriota bacterium]
MAEKPGKHQRKDTKSRADRSRERILSAARSVFSRYPYGAAGVRKIEGAGEFNYALIRYYFGSKKGLFEAVSQELVNEYSRYLLPLIRDTLRNTDPKTALKRFVDGLFDFGFDHPDGPATIMLNIGQAQLFDDTLLGLSAMRRYVAEVTEIFTASIPFAADERKIAMWVFVFTILAANFIGARSFHAAALGLNPESRQYRQWVKKALLAIFEPVLDRFLHGPGIDPEITIPREIESVLPEPPASREKSAGKRTKGDLTRQKILDAALSIFTRRPYSTASIRKIGQEGGFDFTIIHHYFPTKKDLAEAVGNRCYDDFFRQSALFWVSLAQKGASGRVPLSDGLSVYINSLLGYLFDCHHGPAIMMQNIAQPNPQQILPAFNLSLRFYTDISTRLKVLLSIRAPEEEIRMWQYCLVVLISNCVGAPDYPARIIGLSPRKDEYRRWIADALIFLFYPGLKKLVTTSP